MNFIEHKLIKPNSIESREYQTNLANDVKNQNCLILLPDSIRNYLSGFVDDQWMKDNEFID